MRLEDGREVVFRAKDYPHITHGYALSIHKSEGSTVDRAFVKLDPLMDTSTLLVAMTRHRLNVQATLNREEIPDFKALVHKVGRTWFQESLQEYAASKEQAPHRERVQTYLTLLKQSAALRDHMDGPFKASVLEAYRIASAKQKTCAQDILKNWPDHLPFIRMAGLRREVLEVHSGVPRLFSDLEPGKCGRWLQGCCAKPALVDRD